MRKQKAPKKRSFLGRMIVIIVAFILIGLYIFKLTSQTQAAWYNDVWGYRTKLTIDNTKVGGANEVFDIGHETGDLSQYTTTHTDGGNLSITSAAALNGSNYGLSALINDGNQVDAEKNFTKSTKLGLRFYFDPNSVTMANNDEFPIQYTKQNGGGFGTITNVKLGYTTLNGYKLTADVTGDAGWLNEYPVNISDAPHYIEIYITRAATSVSSDGTWQYKVDGTTVVTYTGIDNYNVLSDYDWFQQYGMIESRDAGTSGTIYFDDIIVNSDGMMIGPVLTDFPVYVDLSTLPSSFHQHVNQTDGRDIRITKSDGTTELPREVVSYNAVAKTGELYFKYTGTLNSQTDTSVYIYYGNPVATDYAATATYGRNNVWDGSYVGVWHLQESGNGTSGEFKDSTSHGFNGTGDSSAYPTQASAKLSNGQSFDGSNDNITVGNISSVLNLISATPPSYTISAWLYKSDTSGGDLGGIALTSASPTAPRLTYRSTTTNIGSQLKSGSTVINKTSAIGSWYYAVGGYDSGITKLFLNVNNTASTDTTAADTNLTTLSMNERIGNAGDNYKGLIDEVRVSSIRRSDTWTSTEYNDQNSPSTFFKTIANEEKNRVPVLYFGFNEGYGTTTADLASNTNTGTLVGATKPTWQQDNLCISGKCLYFNGSTASVTVANTVSNLQTVSFWVKPKTNGETLVDFDGGTHYIAASAGTITATGFAGTVTYYINGLPTSTPTLTANTWQHITITTSTPFDATAIKVGNKASAYLNGFIDEFKIYDYARSASDVLSDYTRWAGSKGSSAVLSAINPNIIGPVSNGLTGFWNMDENTGTTITDLSGNSNTGTFNVTPAWSTGKFGSGISFDGASYITVAQNSGLPAYRTTGYSVSLWVKGAGTLSGKQVYTEQNTVNNPLFQIGTGFGDGKVRVFLRDNSDNVWLDQTSTTTAFDNNWHNVVWTDNNGTANLYIDGVKDVSNFNYAPVVALTPALTTLGSNFRSSATNFYTGYLDEVHTYNRVINPTEVQQLYGYAPGPIGWWKMDEKSGTTTYDFSGYGNQADFNGNLTAADWTIGKFGSALSLAGTNKYALALNSTLYDFGTTIPFTMGAWFKAKTNGLHQTIITQTGSVAGGFEIYISESDNKIRVVTGTSTHCGVAGSTVLTDNQWHHIEAVYNRNASCTTSDILVYLDGARETTSVSDSSENSNASINIGGVKIGSGDTKDIIIDNVYIYNYARNTQQATEDLNVGHSLSGSPVGSALGYWKFNEGVDNTCSGGANDACNSGSGGSALDGAESNMSVPATSTSGWANNGKFGKALNFDSTDDAVTITANSSLNLTSGGTISAWIYPNSTGENGFGRIVDKSSDTNATGGYALEMSGNNILAEVAGSSCETYNADSVITYSRWSHVVWTFNGTNWLIYVNGKLFRTCAISTLPPATSLGVTIGNRQGTTDRTFDGYIDEVKIFNSPLTIDQIITLYNQNSSLSMGAVSTDSSGNAINSYQRSYCPPGNTEGNCGGSNDPTPVAHWKLDENTGTKAYDSTGKGHNGTLSATTLWKPCKFGSCIETINADGIRERVDISDATDLNFTGSQSYALSAWVKLYSYENSDQIIFYKGAQDNVTAGYNLAINSSQHFVCNYTDGNGSGLDTVASSTTASTTWHYVACVMDRSGLILGSAKFVILVDGNVENSVTPTEGNSTGNSTPVIGETDSTYEFKSDIDDVRLYPYARSRSQISWDYNRGAPLAWWKMDECTGNTLHDSTGNSLQDLTITINNSNRNTAAGNCSSGVNSDAWYNGRSGKINSGFDFDGSNDGSQTGDFADVAYTDFRSNDTMGTFTTWVKPTNFNQYQYLFSSADQASSNRIVGFAINSSDGTPYMYIQDASGFGTNVPGTTVGLTQGIWSFLAFVSDGTQYKIYINGRPVPIGMQQGSNDGKWFSSVSARDNITLGKLHFNNTYFYSVDGVMDEARLYNYPLSQQQINTVMNNGAVHFGP